MSTATRNVRRSTSPAASDPSPAILFAPDDAEDEGALRFDDDHPLQENFEEKVQHAQEQLLHLRQKQAAIEKEKVELEELGQKQDRFTRGRTDLTEKLNRALAVLDRETFEARSRLEHLAVAKQSFSRHLDILEKFRPEHWSRADLRSELNHAIGAIEDADDDYAKTMARLRVHGGSPAPGARLPEGGAGGADEVLHGLSAWADKNFLDWLKIGTAFTLPLIACLSFYVVLKLVFLL